MWIKFTAEYPNKQILVSMTRLPSTICWKCKCTPEISSSHFDVCLSITSIPRYIAVALSRTTFNIVFNTLLKFNENPLIFSVETKTKIYVWRFNTKEIRCDKQTWGGAEERNRVVEARFASSHVVESRGSPGGAHKQTRGCRCRAIVVGAHRQWKIAAHLKP